MKKESIQKIVLVGSGNLATYIGLSLKGKRNILQVYSKTLANARRLGNKLGCSYTNDLEKISTDADLYIIAVKDDAIEEVFRKLKLSVKVIIHTSGSLTMDVLKNSSDKYGVLWPPYSFANITRNGLKGFTKEKIPFFIEASDKKTERILTDLVEAIKGKPYYTNSEKRAKLHLAAVFVNNFPNYLFTIAESLSKEAGVPFKVFLPIAEETVENFKTQSPALSQTGPAKRNDKRILEKHLSLLKKYPGYKEVYQVLTKSIIKASEKKEL